MRSQRPEKAIKIKGSVLAFSLDFATKSTKFTKKNKTASTPAVCNSLVLFVSWW